MKHKSRPLIIHSNPLIMHPNIFSILNSKNQWQPSKIKAEIISVTANMLQSYLKPISTQVYKIKTRQDSIFTLCTQIHKTSTSTNSNHLNNLKKPICIEIEVQNLIMEFPTSVPCDTSYDVKFNNFSTFALESLAFNFVNQKSMQTN